MSKSIMPALKAHEVAVETRDRIEREESEQLHSDVYHAIGAAINRGEFQCFVAWCAKRPVMVRMVETLKREGYGCALDTDDAGIEIRWDAPKV